MHDSQRLLCPVYEKLWSACEAPSFHPWVSREPLASPLCEALKYPAVTHLGWGLSSTEGGLGWGRKVWLSGLVFQRTHIPA